MASTRDYKSPDSVASITHQINRWFLSSSPQRETTPSDVETLPSTPPRDSEEPEVLDDLDDINLDANKQLKFLKLGTFEWLDCIEKSEHTDWRKVRLGKLAEQEMRVPELRERGLTDDSIDLFMLLERRAVEPLFPTWWNIDFELAEHNFAVDRKNAVLGVLDERTEGHARISLRELMKIGSYSRDVYKSSPTSFGRRNEAIMVRLLKGYQRWANSDAGVKKLLVTKQIVPLLTTITGYEGASTDHIEKRLLQKLQSRAARLLAILRKPGVHPTNYGLVTSYYYPPPSLYGIAMLGQVVAVVAYQPLCENEKLHPIIFLPFDNPLSDQWNALALAIVIAHCRNHSAKIREALGLVVDDSLLPIDDEDL